MTTTEEQLVSFFLYSLFIYPVTNYLVSAKRAYPRWKGACYAILFLAIISTVHMLYENREKGPNHYNLLGVSRGTSTANLKRAYRTLSLELHPDKNKSPTAPEQFRKVKQAFDVLLNPDTRQVLLLQPRSKLKDLYRLLSNLTLPYLRRVIRYMNVWAMQG